MEILSNWIFWVVLASIVFVLALIGYLTESMKQSSKKKENKDAEVNDTDDSVTNVVSTPAPTVTTTTNDDWTTMPEVNKPLEEVKVDSIDEVSNESPVSTDSVDAPVNNGADMFADVNMAKMDEPTENVSNTEVNNVETPVNFTENTTPISSMPENVVSPEQKPTETLDVNSAPAENTPAEPLNTSESDDKNIDIWNL